MEIKKILEKLIYEKFEVIFTIGTNDTKLRWFNFKFNNHFYHCGYQSNNNIYISIQYVPNKDSGTGTILIENFQEKWFELDNKEEFEKFKISLIKESQFFLEKNQKVKLFKDSTQFCKNKALSSFIINPNILTYDDWKKSGQSFTECAKNYIGYKIDEDIFDYFNEVLPPITGHNWLMVSEPYDTIMIQNKTIDRYITFHRFKNEWYYSGIRYILELKKWDTFLKDCYGEETTSR
jgi:hypothetical protein